MKCDTPMTFEEAKAGLGIVDRQPIPTTNEEWFCNLSTEEKAKIFHKIFMVRTFCHICPEGGVCDIGYKCKYHEGEVEDFVMWLKQPHSPK